MQINKKEEAEDPAFYQEKENALKGPCYSLQQPPGHPLDKPKYLWDTGSISFLLNLVDNIIVGWTTLCLAFTSVFGIDFCKGMQLHQEMHARAVAQSDGVCELLKYFYMETENHYLASGC